MQIPGVRKTSFARNYRLLVDPLYRPDPHLTKAKLEYSQFLKQQMEDKEKRSSEYRKKMQAEDEKFEQQLRSIGTKPRDQNREHQHQNREGGRDYSKDHREAHQREPAGKETQQRERRALTESDELDSFVASTPQHGRVGEILRASCRKELQECRRRTEEVEQAHRRQLEELSRQLQDWPTISRHELEQDLETIRVRLRPIRVRARSSDRKADFFH
jgi:hypothetical protein